MDPFFIRQGQASCYEGSGRAPPLGPPPSVDHPTLPPTQKEGTGITQASFISQKVLLLNTLLHCYSSASSVSPCNIFPNLHPTHPEAAHLNQHAIKRESYYVPYCCSGNLQGTKTVCSGEAIENLLPIYFLYLKPTPDADLRPWQATSRTAVTCAAPSSTDRPT